MSVFNPYRTLRMPAHIVERGIIQQRFEVAIANGTPFDSAKQALEIVSDEVDRVLNLDQLLTEYDLPSALIFTEANYDKALDFYGLKGADIFHEVCPAQSHNATMILQGKNRQVDIQKIADEMKRESLKNLDDLVQYSGAVFGVIPDGLDYYFQFVGNSSIDKQGVSHVTADLSKALTTRFRGRIFVSLAIPMTRYYLIEPFIPQ